MVENKKWVCFYISDSLLEINFLRAILESKGIDVNVCTTTSSRHHDYLHDKKEKIKVFVPVEKLSDSQIHLKRLADLNQIQAKNIP